MGPHDRTVKAQMDAGAANPRVSLNLCILNLAGKLATGAPSKSSKVTTLSEVINCLNLYSSLSIWACGSSEVGVSAMTGGGATSVRLCRVKCIACGADWLGGGGGGTIGSYWAPSWGRTCWAYCPSILRLRLAIASWIEAMVIANWSTVTICEFISLWSDIWSDLSDAVINLPPTLIQKVEPRPN